MPVFFARMYFQRIRLWLPVSECLQSGRTGYSPIRIQTAAYQDEIIFFVHHNRFYGTTLHSISCPGMRYVLTRYCQTPCIVGTEKNKSTGFLLPTKTCTLLYLIGQRQLSARPKGIQYGIPYSFSSSAFFSSTSSRSSSKSTEPSPPFSACCGVYFKKYV